VYTVKRAEKGMEKEMKQRRLAHGGRKTENSDAEASNNNEAKNEKHFSIINKANKRQMEMEKLSGKSVSFVRYDALSC
jgi:hypothetical protein